MRIFNAAMDNKKNRRRSSIKRTSVFGSHPESDSTDVTVRQKRRISFSGKKSVREFHGETEPKKWDNSYELSDAVNSSADTKNTNETERSRCGNATQSTMTMIPTEDKENVMWSALVQHASKMQSGELTMLHRQNSGEHPSVTFSLFEDEFRVLQRTISPSLEHTVDYLRELQSGYESVIQTEAKKAMVTNSQNEQKRKTITCNDDMIESFCGDKNHKGALDSKQVSKNVTIFVNECIGEQEKSVVEKNARRRTMRVAEDMQLSIMGETAIANNTKVECKGAADSFSVSMDLESPVRQQTQPRAVTPHDDMILEEMAESFSEKLNMFSLHEPGIEHLPPTDMHVTTSCLGQIFQEPTKKEAEEASTKLNEPSLQKAPMLLDSATKRKNAPKVVRKICTPILKPLAAMEKKRFQRQACVPSEIRTEPEKSDKLHKANSAFDVFASANDSNMSFASDLNSPLFPAEFVASVSKKMNFRQLNDDIEYGKIQIFPEAEIRKSVGKQLFGAPTASEAIKSVADCGMEISPMNKLRHRDSVGCKRDFRLSEADDMLLDNTSFLVKAKLGDETASRNSSKCSSINRRETIHFNSEIDATLVEEEADKVDCVKSTQPTQNEEDVEVEKKEILVEMEATQFNVDVEKNIPLAAHRMSIFEPEDMNLSEVMSNESVRVMDNANFKAPKCVPRHKRQTLLFEHDMDIDEHKEEHGKYVEKQPKVEQCEQKKRQTLILCSDIPLDESIIQSKYVEIGQNEVKAISKSVQSVLCNEPEKHKTHAELNAVEQHKDVEKEPNAKQRQQKKRQTLILCSDIPLDESIIQPKYMECDPKKEKTYYDSVQTTASNKVEKHKTRAEFDKLEQGKDVERQPNHGQKQQKKRQTLILCSDIPLDESIIQPKYMENDPNKENPASDTLQTTAANKVEKHKTRQTLIFATDNNEIPLDESMHASSEVNTNTTEVKSKTFVDFHHQQLKPMNAAKAILMRQDAMNLKLRSAELEDSLLKKLDETRALTFSSAKRKTVHFDANEMEVSPVANSEQQLRNQRTFDGTPHRSVIEFEYYEMVAEQEEALETQKTYPNDDSYTGNEKPNKFSLTTHDPTAIVLDESGLQPLENMNATNMTFVSPVVSIDNARKRLTANLTPNLPTSKKRQTLIFENCDLEDSMEQDEGVAEGIQQIVELNKTCLKQHNINATCEQSDVQDEVNISSPAAEAEQMDITLTNDSNLNTEALIQQQNELNKTPESSPVLPARVDTPSRIPVLIESAKRKKSAAAHFTPRKTSNESTLNYSLDTIQIPRKATNFVQHAEQSIKLCTTADETALNPSIMNEADKIDKPQKQKSAFFAFEDNPITISDVSVHYLKQRRTGGNNTESQGIILSKLDSNDTSPCMEEQINMLRISLIECDDIEKTHLSLVDGIESDEEDNDNDDECEGDEVEKIKTLRENCVQTSEGSVVMCRKCRKCQETLLDETMTNPDETWALPPMPEFPSLGLEELERIRMRPGIADVHEYWRRKSLELSLNSTNASSLNVQHTLVNIQGIDEAEEEREQNEAAVAKMVEQIRCVEQQLSALQSQRFFKSNKSFVENLQELLSERAPNWIFDSQLQHRKMLIFSHRKLVTFVILIQFEETSALGETIEITNIKLHESRVPKKNWKPIDHFMDLQFRLDLPYNLQSECSSNEPVDVLRFLQHIDNICMNVVRTGYQMWRLVCSQQASLVRDNDRTVVRKITRGVINDGDYLRVEQTEYKIELTNIKHLSFKNIVAPPLYKFSEHIQFLPTGVEFLYAFLKNPVEHLKKYVHEATISECNHLTFVVS